MLALHTVPIGHHASMSSILLVLVWFWLATLPLNVAGHCKCTSTQVHGKRRCADVYYKYVCCTFCMVQRNIAHVIVSASDYFPRAHCNRCRSFLQTPGFNTRGGFSVDGLVVCGFIFPPMSATLFCFFADPATRKINELNKNWANEAGLLNWKVI